MRWFLLLIIPLFAACMGADADEPTATPGDGLPPARLTEIARNTAEAPDNEPETSGSIPVVYRITTTGNQRIQITYENETGNTEQTSTTTQDAIWEKQLMLNPGDFVYVSAQLGDAIGGIDCEIEVDGRVTEQAHSSGAFSIATCSGTVN